MLIDSSFYNYIYYSYAGEARRKLCAQSCKAIDWVNYYYTIIQYLLSMIMWTSSARYNLLLLLLLVAIN